MGDMLYVPGIDKYSAVYAHVTRGTAGRHYLLPRDVLQEVGIYLRVCDEALDKSRIRWWVRIPARRIVMALCGADLGYWVTLQG